MVAQQGSLFPPDIIDMIVEHVNDDSSLKKLYTVSPYWKYAARRKRYKEIDKYKIGDINRDSELATYVQKFTFNLQTCGFYCDSLRSLKLCNLKELHFGHKLCSNAKEFFQRHQQFQHLELIDYPSFENVQKMAQFVTDTRLQEQPFQQPILYYYRQPVSTFTLNLHRVGFKSIRVIRAFETYIDKDVLAKKEIGARSNHSIICVKT